MFEKYEPVISESEKSSGGNEDEFILAHFGGSQSHPAVCL